MKSIIQTDRECWVCKTTEGLHLHHILFGAGHRELSDRHGLTVWLCGRHHNLSNEGVHFNKEFDLHLRRLAQAKFEETHSREEFVKLFQKNYLE